MAFKRCGKVRYVDSVLKENEEDTDSRKVYRGRESRQNCATVELAIDVAAVVAEKHCKRVSQQKHDRKMRPTRTAAARSREKSARVCHVVEEPCWCCAAAGRGSKTMRDQKASSSRAWSKVGRGHGAPR
jgi:hypothetical protein